MKPVLSVPDGVKHARITVEFTNKRKAAKWCKELEAAGFVASLDPLENYEPKRGATVIVRGRFWNLSSYPKLALSLEPL